MSVEAPHDERRDLSLDQRQMWLAEQAHGDRTRFLITSAWRTAPGVRVEVGALRRALDQLHARHPALTRSHRVDEEGLLVGTDGTAPAGRVVVRAIDAPCDSSAVRSAVETEASLPFALVGSALLRLSVVRAADGDVLVLCGHHLVLDEWSLEVVWRDLAHVYAGGDLPSVPATGPTKGPAVAARPDGAQHGDGQRYWRDLLAGATTVRPARDLLTDDASTGVRATEAVHDDLTGLDHECWTRLGASPLAAAVTAWVCALRWLTDDSDVVVGVPFSGRADGEHDEVVDCLVRILPVRVVLDDDLPLTEVAVAVGEQLLSSMVHESIDLDSVRTPSSRLTDLLTSVVAQAVSAATINWAGLQLTAWDLGGSSGKFPLSFGIEYDAVVGRLRLRLDYDTDAFLPATATALLRRVRQVLVSLLGPTPGVVGRCLPPGRTASPRPAGETSALELVLEAARRDPDACAVVDVDGTRTGYADLVARAGRLAWQLRREGVGAEDVVALVLPRGLAAVVSMLAVNLAGAAYLPLDPDDPPDRLRAVLDDAHPVLVVTQASCDLGTPDIAVRTYVELERNAQALPSAPPDVVHHPDGLVNVLFTSGSTGGPKGVALTSRGLARLVGQKGVLDLGAQHVLAHLAPLNFDGATFEVWGALAAGARLVCLPKELAIDPVSLRAALVAEGVDGLLLVTPLLNRVIDECPEVLQSLDFVYFGGEAISVPHVVKALQWCRPGTLVHSYGPTENSFTSTCLRIEQVDPRSRTIAIGHPVPGTTVHVVREGTFDLVPEHGVGELLVGGAGLARGYLGRPGVTARAFVPNPFGPAGSRLYRTGDVVRLLPGGAVEFVQRRDRQVKIRSQRVELTEVEAALRALPGVVDAYATTRSDHEGAKQLVAYVVPGPAAPWDELETRTRLAERLPAYMVPPSLVPVPALPVTANGKVDLSRLPAVTSPGTRSGNHAASAHGAMSATTAATDLEEEVARAWATTLGVDDVGRDVNFFDAGGHSLLVTVLQRQLEQRVHRRPSVADLLRWTTVRSQARFLAGHVAPAHLRSVVHGRPPAPDQRLAVVGMACRLPGAVSPNSLWRNIVRGIDGIAGDVPTMPLHQMRRHVRRWGVLDPVPGFDGRPFGLPPGTGETWDLSYQALFAVVWEAVEDAGLRMSDIRHRTALYAGAAQPPARSAPTAPGSGAALLAAATSQDVSFAATRLAYHLGLGEEAVLVDTACSTSLVAVHLAGQSLLSGSCDTAVVACSSWQARDDEFGYTYEPGLIYAEDGVCRPFDQQATGTVGGDGVVAVVLRRLDDALAAGDPVHAVLAATAVNNDGRDKVAFTAPSVAGQVQVINQCLERARLKPIDVGQVETHGTGTVLGDTTEAAALAEVFGAAGRRAPLALSAVKSWVGHTNVSAGLTGLVSAVLAVRNGVHPGVAHLRTALDIVAEHKEALSVTRQCQPWSEGVPRRSGVSSFGIGGTNAHAVVEQAPGGAS